jgi:hypothetical protein
LSIGRDAARNEARRAALVLKAGSGDGTMHARNLMLAVIGGGTLLGTLGGLAINTDMKPPPDPPWRHASQSGRLANDSYQLVDSGPQDLSPGWYADRTPTWKRDLAYRPAVYAPVDGPVVDDASDGPVATDPASTFAATDGVAAARNVVDTSQAALAPQASADPAQQQAEPVLEDEAAL